MVWFIRVWSSLRVLVRRRRLEAQLQEELEFHVESRANDLVAAGLSSHAAQEQARRELGDPARWREDARSAVGLLWFDELSSDVRIGARVLARSPIFTATTIFVLAIGIGAATSVFTQLNAVLWRELPVTRPQELRVFAWAAAKRGFLNVPAIAGPATVGVGETFESFSYPAYESLAAHAASSFSDVACWHDPGELMPVVMGDLGFGSLQFVSGNYFRTLGVRASVGRTIEPDDSRDEASARAVVVLTHRFWQRAYGGEVSAVGRSMMLNGTQFSIIGVLPEGFFGLDPSISPDAMVPMGMYRIASAGGQGALSSQANWSLCRVVGRLRPGITEEQARVQAEVGVRAGTTAPRWPPPGRVWELPRVWTLPASKGVSELRRASVQPMSVLTVAVAAILLIACANIAALLLSRGQARAKEIATRLAIGAPRYRVVRQLLTESALLAGAGGAAGVLLAYALDRATPSVLSRFLPMVEGATRNLGVSLTPDWRVLLFSVATVVAAGLGFGVLPALRSTRIDPSAVMRQVALRPNRRWSLDAAKLMLALQTALSISLLVGAGLFVRTVLNLRSADIGYKTDNLLYVRVEPRAGGMYGGGGISNNTVSRRRAAFFEEVIKHFASTPGIVSASASLSPPMASYGGAGSNTEDPVACTKYSAAGIGDATYEAHQIAPGFFKTLGVPILAGRELEWADRAAGLGRASTAVVNESFVRRFFPTGINAVGESFGSGRFCPDNTAVFTIVGVVPDARLLPRNRLRPAMYQVLGTPPRPITLLLRTNGDAAAMIPSVRRAMVDFDPTVPLFGETTPEDLLEQYIRQERLLGSLFAVFAAFATLLCCLALYTLLSHSVSARRTEIGIRMAIGASRSDVVRLVVAQSVAPIAVGIVGSSLIFVAATRLLEATLFGVSGLPQSIFAVASIVFLVIAAVAASIPARVASRLDPVGALRCE